MHETIRVLCVDDEKNILNTIRRQLENDSFEVHLALTVEEALGILDSAQPIHVVLSDYRMPGTHGIEFLRKVSKNWPWIAGIIISGLADTAAVQQALQENSFVRFIPKPWTMEELRKAVTEAATSAINKLHDRGTV